MSWDVEQEIAAPVRTVFDCLSTWHRHENLRSLAAVEDYRVLANDGRSEYFRLRVRDLPIKRSYCYGKRLMRRPDIIITIFTYRLLRADRLANPAEIERLMRSDWESFFYQTARLRPLGPRLTLLRVAEPGVDDPRAGELDSTRRFFAELGSIAEGEGEGAEAEAEEYEADDGGFGSGWAWRAASEGEYNPYAVLGVTASAPDGSVKSAYRTLALRWHPDKLTGSRAALKEYAHNRFIEITAAYHTILRLRNL